MILLETGSLAPRFAKIGDSSGTSVMGFTAARNGERSAVSPNIASASDPDH